MAEAARWSTVLEEARGLLRLAETTTPAVARRPSAVVGLDHLLGGGVPVGRIVEVWGALSSGSTALVLALAAGVTSRGGTVAWIDAFDALDPASMAAAGCDLARVLWVRALPADRPSSSTSFTTDARSFSSLGGEAVPPTPDARTQSAHRKQLLRALDLVLSTEGFSLVVLDAMTGLGQKRLFVPDTTWVRISRACAARRTTLVVLGERPSVGPQSTFTLSMGARSSSPGDDEGALRVKVARARGPLVRGEGELRIVASPIEPWALRQARGRVPITRARKRAAP